MRRPKKDIQLTSYDELLGLEETPEKSMNQVVEIDLAKLYPFKNHPFHVNDDEKEAVNCVERLHCQLLSEIIRMMKRSLLWSIPTFSVKIYCQVRKLMPIR